ncbi:predicted protein [Plenodomus lingam JN3]|uniref:Uncharacterized protein n=1 Tax=Leptosphaeria maculans (strain JN3 / isolate v23.1.3 / race Av1-4-5-6-7-8) TaxID=985895 RepID=M1ZIV2_LEPMJ|nr:predicted protein [Plenodomus lingam JN3]
MLVHYSPWVSRTSAPPQSSKQYMAASRPEYQAAQLPKTQIFGHRTSYTLHVSTI